MKNTQKNNRIQSNGDLSGSKTNEDYNKKTPSRNDVIAVNGEQITDEKEDNVRKLASKKPNSTTTNKHDNDEQHRKSPNDDKNKPIVGEKKAGLMVSTKRK